MLPYFPILNIRTNCLRKYYMKKFIYFGAILLAAVSMLTPLLATSVVSAAPACTRDEQLTGSEEELPPCSDPAVSAGGQCPNARNCSVITQYVQPMVDFLAAFVGVAVVISMIYGGIEYASSGGDPQKAAAGKNRIRNAIGALLLFLFFYAFLRFALLPGDLI